MKFKQKPLSKPTHVKSIPSRNFQNHNLIYVKDYVTTKEKEVFLNYLKRLYPIWENRYSDSNQPPAGETNRQLLRPVYWLGNWQFACLDYYHPPKGIKNRCVAAEEYPSVIQHWIKKIESLVHEKFDARDIPKDWTLNTCLINYYGQKIENLNGQIKKTDSARVGEHKDFEPGPIASISFGEKALFQFVRSQGKSKSSEVVLQQWLEDCSLQLFGGDKFKKQLFHRVQRVEEKLKPFDDLNTENFETRRINLTFRYVPRDHIQPYHKFPENLQNDIIGYIKTLAKKSNYWRDLQP
jgi:DNA oxidative demethylase